MYVPSKKDTKENKKEHNIMLSLLLKELDARAKFPMTTEPINP